MSLIYFHPYHMVDQSPWPLMAASSAFMLTSGLILQFKYFNSLLLIMGILLMMISAMQWWRDTWREASIQGHHTSFVEMGMRYGMILFITSEVLFFMSFFWAFFHSSLSATIELGLNWPPKSIISFNAFQVPLLNTIVLLSSGISVTWAHHSLLNKAYSHSVKSLLITVILGVYFTMIQGYEYLEASFTMADSAFGSTFFIATGFHGLHVIIGTIFLAICGYRLMKGQFSSKHHMGFEAAAWYWHFVDVVWLFLFISIYWWGGS